MPTPRALELIRHGNSVAMIVADFGGENLPLNVYSNSEYAASLGAFQSCKTDACPLPNDGPNFSLQRFVQAARMVSAYDGARDPAGGLVMLGKTFKGLTDETLRWRRRWMSRASARRRSAT